MRILLYLFLCYPLVIMSKDRSIDKSNNVGTKPYSDDSSQSSDESSNQNTEKNPQQVPSKVNDSSPVLYPVTKKVTTNATHEDSSECWGENEESTDCYNPCETTCATRFQDDKVCIEDCKPGCTCEDGHLRDDNKICVPIDQCSPAKCNDNEINIKCGPACGEKTCENFDSTCHFCTRPCLDACFCKSGLVRSQNGTCIPVKNCPPRVCNGPNEYFDECPRLCPPQECCYNQSTLGCDPTVCCNPSCQCEYGFLRDEDGDCVPENQCPPLPTECGVNEVLTDCYNECAPTCKTRFRWDEGLCKPYCKIGCTCRHGYFRHDNGCCVAKYECSPPKCKRKEVYKKCGSACEETCFEYTSGFTEDCSQQCVEGCFCKTGTVRTWDGSCIKPKHCPKPLKCGPNEVYSKCKQTDLFQTCNSLWSSHICTTLNHCAEPGCNCKDGYLRNGTAYDSCIHISQCPLTPHTTGVTHAFNTANAPASPIPPDWYDRK